jgi:hypothetical protein
MRRTRPGAAPSAIRNPISGVRCETVYAHAVQADGREQRRQRREARRQRADHAIEEHVVARLLLHRPQVLHQQVRDVGARDRQHQAGDTEQQPERRRRLAMDRALPAASLLDPDLLRSEALHRLVAHPALQRRLDVVDDAAVLAVERGTRLLEGDARLPPREEVRPVAPPVVEAGEAGLHESAHRDRHEHLWLRSERRPVEAARRNAHDRHRLAVDDQRLAGTFGFSSKRVRQYAWLSTTTWDSPTFGSSPGPSRRPSPAATPSTGK